MSTAQKQAVAKEPNGKWTHYPKLGQMPAQWKAIPFKAAFEEVKAPVDVDPATSYKEIGIRSHGKGLFHKEVVLGSSLGGKAVYWVQPDCLVANIVFAWEQGIARTTEGEVGMIASHRFPMFKPKENVVDLDFVLYFFKTGRGRLLLEDASPGGAGRNKTLSRTELYRSLIPLPPLPEQQRIARILGTWDRAIGLLQEQIAAKELRLRGLIDQLVSGQRHGATNGQLPKGWKWVRLGEVGSFKKGKGISKGDLQAEGVPCITYGELYTLHHIRVKRFHSFIKQETTKASERIYKGDLLFAGSGETSAEIGKAAVYLGDAAAYAGGDVVILRPKKIDPLYLSVALSSAIANRQRVKYAQGNSVVHLYPSQLADFKVPMPPSLLQEQVAGMVRAVDDELEVLEKQLDQLQHQKKGLMQELLSGRNTMKS